MSAPHRCGLVALVGRPNAGKSTLQNALLGEKVSITASRAQTTRSRILGVVTRPGLQLVLYDTPGLSRGQARFNRAMSEAALGAARDCDVRLLLFEAGAVWDEPEKRLADLPQPLILVRTKCDLGPPGPVPQPERFTSVEAVSALSGDGVESLLQTVGTQLPEGPPLYDADFLTDRPLRFLAAEQIREVAFERLHDELPYALAVEIEEWKESQTGIRIRANLLLEHEHQKGLVVGRGGRKLGELGTEARQRLSKWLGKPVHLKLWVKLDRNWSKRPKRARELGYL